MESLVIFAGELTGEEVLGVSDPSELAEMRYDPWPYSHRLVHSRYPSLGWVEMSGSYTSLLLGESENVEFMAEFQTVGIAFVFYLRNGDFIVSEDPTDAFRNHNGSEVYDARSIIKTSVNWSFSGTPLGIGDHPLSGQYFHGRMNLFCRPRIVAAGPNFIPSFPYGVDAVNRPQLAIQFRLVLGSGLVDNQGDGLFPDGVYLPPAFPNLIPTGTADLDPATETLIPTPGFEESLALLNITIGAVEWIHPPGY
jgi:hypothetical protein